MKAPEKGNKWTIYTYIILTLLSSLFMFFCLRKELIFQKISRKWTWLLLFMLKITDLFMISNSLCLLLLSCSWWRYESPGADVEQLCLSGSWQPGFAHFSFSPWQNSEGAPNPDISSQSFLQLALCLQLFLHSPDVLHRLLSVSVYILLLFNHKPLVLHSSTQL